MSVKVIRAAGSWTEIGLKYGAEMAAEIDAAMAVWEKRLFEEGWSPADLRARLDEYRRAGERDCPERMEELEGLASGAGLDVTEGLLLNCLEDLDPFDACTTMATPRFLLHVEMWLSEHRDVGVLIASPTKGPTFATVSCAGFLTGVGMSCAGFAQGVQTLRAQDERVAAPRACFARAALAAPSMRAAAAMALGHERSGGNGFVLCSEDATTVVETTATAGTERELKEPAAHTNHYLSSLAQLGVEPSQSSVSRLAAATAALRTRPPSSLPSSMQLLAAPGIIACLPESGAESADSATAFLLACDVVTGEMAISGGPDVGSVWTRVTVDEPSTGNTVRAPAIRGAEVSQ